MESRTERRALERKLAKEARKADTPTPMISDPAALRDAAATLRTQGVEGLTSASLAPILETVTAAAASASEGASEKDALKQVVSQLLTALTGLSGNDTVDVGRLRQSLPSLDVEGKKALDAVTKGKSRMKMKDLRTALSTFLLGA